MEVTDSIIQNCADTLLVGLSSKADEVCTFAENDPHGLLMAILGMSIVFSALILLFVIFNNTPAIFKKAFKEKIKDFFTLKKIHKQADASVEIEKVKEEEFSGEINAAIAAAIYLYRSELHDYEDTILTIKKVSRTYSPWSSKIYGLRNTPKLN